MEDFKDFKDLPEKGIAGKILCDKHLILQKNPMYDGYHSGLASMVYCFFNKKTSNTNRL